MPRYLLPRSRGAGQEPTCHWVRSPVCILLWAPKSSGPANGSDRLPSWPAGRVCAGRDPQHLAPAGWGPWPARWCLPPKARSASVSGSPADLVSPRARLPPPRTLHAPHSQQGPHADSEHSWGRAASQPPQSRGPDGCALPSRPPVPLPGGWLTAVGAQCCDVRLPTCPPSV